MAQWNQITGTELDCNQGGNESPSPTMRGTSRSAVGNSMKAHRFSARGALRAWGNGLEDLDILRGPWEVEVELPSPFRPSKNAVSMVQDGGN